APNGRRSFARRARRWPICAATTSRGRCSSTTRGRWWPAKGSRTIQTFPKEWKNQELWLESAPLLGPDLGILTYHDDFFAGAMRNRILIAATLLLAAVSASPQQQGTIEHTPISCIVGGELPMMMVSTVDDGVLRAYFRRLGTVDWCSVDGKNLGKASNVILPR